MKTVKQFLEMIRESDNPQFLDMIGAEYQSFSVKEKIESLTNLLEAALMEDGRDSLVETCLANLTAFNLDGNQHAQGIKGRAEKYLTTQSTNEQPNNVADEDLNSAAEVFKANNTNYNEIRNAFLSQSAPKCTTATSIFLEEWFGNLEPLIAKNQLYQQRIGNNQNVIFTDIMTLVEDLNKLEHLFNPGINEAIKAVYEKLKTFPDFKESNKEMSNADRQSAMTTRINNTTSYALPADIPQAEEISGLAKAAPQSTQKQSKSDELQCINVPESYGSWFKHNMADLKEEDKADARRVSNDFGRCSLSMILDLNDYSTEHNEKLNSLLNELVKLNSLCDLYMLGYEKDSAPEYLADNWVYKVDNNKLIINFRMLAKAILTVHYNDNDRVLQFLEDHVYGLFSDDSQLLNEIRGLTTRGLFQDLGNGLKNSLLFDIGNGMAYRPVVEPDNKLMIKPNSAHLEADYKITKLTPSDPLRMFDKTLMIDYTETKNAPVITAIFNQQNQITSLKLNRNSNHLDISEQLFKFSLLKEAFQKEHFQEHVTLLPFLKYSEIYSTSESFFKAFDEYLLENIVKFNDGQLKAIYQLFVDFYEVYGIRSIACLPIIERFIAIEKNAAVRENMYSFHRKYSVACGVSREIQLDRLIKSTQSNALTNIYKLFDYVTDGKARLNFILSQISILESTAYFSSKRNDNTATYKMLSFLRTILELRNDLQTLPLSLLKVDIANLSWVEFVAYLANLLSPAVYNNLPISTQNFILKLKTQTYNLSEPFVSYNVKDFGVNPKIKDIVELFKNSHNNSSALGVGNLIVNAPHIEGAITVPHIVIDDTKSKTSSTNDMLAYHTEPVVITRPDNTMAGSNGWSSVLRTVDENGIKVERALNDVADRKKNAIRYDYPLSVNDSVFSAAKNFVKNALLLVQGNTGSKLAATINEANSKVIKIFSESRISLSHYRAVLTEFMNTQNQLPDYLKRGYTEAFGKVEFNSSWNSFVVRFPTLNDETSEIAEKFGSLNRRMLSLSHDEYFKDLYNIVSACYDSMGKIKEEFSHLDNDIKLLVSFYGSSTDKKFKESYVMFITKPMKYINSISEFTKLSLAFNSDDILRLDVVLNNVEIASENFFENSELDDNAKANEFNEALEFLDRQIDAIDRSIQISSAPMPLYHMKTTLLDLRISMLKNLPDNTIVHKAAFMECVKVLKDMKIHYNPTDKIEAQFTLQSFIKDLRSISKDKGSILLTKLDLLAVRIKDLGSKLPTEANKILQSLVDDSSKLPLTKLRDNIVECDAKLTQLYNDLYTKADNQHISAPSPPPAARCTMN